MSQGSDEAVLGGKLCSLLILFEIRLIKDHCYECVEISRIHLEEHIKWLFDVENMIVNETEGKILFQVTKLDYFQTIIVFVLLYDVKTRTIEDNIVTFENSKDSFYFVDHTDFKGGIIVAVSCDCSEIKICTKNSEMGYVIFKSFPFKFNDEDPRLYCISNRRNQILFFQVGQSNVTIYDLFDTSNKAVLTITTDERPLQLHFNKTGEELFIYNGRKMIFIQNHNLSRRDYQSIYINTSSCFNCCKF